MGHQNIYRCQGSPSYRPSNNHMPAKEIFAWYSLYNVDQYYGDLCTIQPLQSNYDYVDQPFNCSMGLLPDTQNCGLRMRREWWECFPRHRLKWKLLASDHGMHHGTSVTHVLWCMSGSLTCGGGENVPDIPGACATRNFTYLTRGPCTQTDTCHLEYRTVLVECISWLCCPDALQIKILSHTDAIWRCWYRSKIDDAVWLVPWRHQSILPKGGLWFWFTPTKTHFTDHNWYLRYQNTHKHTHTLIYIYIYIYIYMGRMAFMLRRWSPYMRRCSLPNIKISGGDCFLHYTYVSFWILTIFGEWSFEETVLGLLQIVW